MQDIPGRSVLFCGTLYLFFGHMFFLSALPSAFLLPLNAEQFVVLAHDLDICRIVRVELKDALESVLSLDPFPKDTDSLFVYPVTAEYFRYAFHLLMDSLVLCVHPPGRCLRFYHFLLKTGTFTQIGKLRVLKAGVSAFPERLKGFSPHGFRKLPRDGLIDAVVITPDILVGSGGSLFAPLQSKGMHLLSVGRLEPGAALHAADIVGCIQDALFIDRDDECVQVRDPLVLVEDDGTHIVQMDRFFRAVVVMDIGFPSRRVERLIQPFNVPLDPFLKIDPICAGRESHEDFKSVSSIGADLLITPGELKPDAVVLTTGGGTAGILRDTGIELVPPVPSLFTFKVGDDGLRSLMGTVVEDAALSIAGTRFHSSGTLLLTDWGVSGPATLRLSSYAARYLAENQYKATLLINWLNCSEGEVSAWLEAMSGGARLIANCHHPLLSDRLWRHLLGRAGIRNDCRWSELGSKGRARLISVLTADSYPLTGRAAFKEEFVTCGGVALSEVDPSSMQSRKVPGLYFAGEVLDIDAVTGGFNLQAAWSTAWVAAHAIAQSLS